MGGRVGVYSVHAAHIPRAFASTPTAPAPQAAMAIWPHVERRMGYINSSWKNRYLIISYILYLICYMLYVISYTYILYLISYNLFYSAPLIVSVKHHHQIMIWTSTSDHIWEVNPNSSIPYVYYTVDLGPFPPRPHRTVVIAWHEEDFLSCEPLYLKDLKYFRVVSRYIWW